MKIGNTKSFFILCLCLMTVIHVYTNWCGIGQTFDSYRYISASVNLGKFYFLEPIDGQVIFRPPLYPTILSMLNGNLIGIRFVHLLVALGGLFLFERIISISTPNVIFKNFAIFLYATSTPLLINSSFAWTESFVILLSLIQLKLLLSDKPDAWDKSFWWIVILGVAIGLLKRGSVLLIPGVFIILLINNHSIKGLLRALIYGCSAYLSTLLWDIYQGRASVPGAQIPETTEYLNVVSTWLIPMSFNTGLREASISVLLISLIAGYFYLKQFKSVSDSKTQLIFLVLFFCYLILRWKFASLDYFESDRYLSVAFPFFLLSLLGLLSWILDYSDSGKKIVLAFLILWSSYSGIRYIKNATQIHQDRCRETIESL
ncbi:MAG: hypothetical protein ACI83W_000056 [Marinoscillum sp.]